MYDLRQFRFTLYALILIGFAAFGMAAESPGVWLMGTAAVLLNGWLVRTGRFVPMPRLLANVVTVGCMLYIAREVLTSPTPPVIVIGQFLVLLQLIKLWEQRANRDFAQLLVLSLLLVVAASINTASLWFGLLLIGYLFLSLYCCLLFHLKVETDTAKAAFPLPDARVNPATLRRDQRHLSRSMRRLTGFVALVSVAMAVFVFLLFPRGGTNVFAGMQFRSGQTLSGFSDQVQFEQVARITQNDKVVAHVQLWHNDEPVRGNRQLLLRGVTLDTYNSDPNSRTLARWVRTNRPDDFRPLDRSAEWQIERGEHPEVWRQRVHLLPTGTNVLFALPGAVSFTPLNRDAKVRFTRDDGVLQLAEPIQQPIQYDVISTDQLGGPPEASLPAALRGLPRNLADRFRTRYGAGGAAPPEAPPRTDPANIDKQIRAYAQRPEVCGTDEQGRPLGTLRLNAGGAGGPDARALDERIAQNFERHLQKDFAYTLDLTDTPRKPGVDPMAAFLTDFKKGHCEYFAGAMALMCQSLGMDARVVVGFKTDEYNDFSDQYVVRQSHAHAWVEVLTAGGWQTFDPTSGRDPRDQQNASASLGKKLKHLLDYLQFTYANSVIAYDNDQRENMLQEAENKMFDTAVRGDRFLGRLRGALAGLLGNPSFWNLSSWLLVAALVVAIGGSVGLVGWFVWERWRLRRRAARIGLDGLDPDDRDRLARQLGFYDDLLRLLARHEIVRPPHQTPMEFSRSLLFLPGGAYETVRRLTGLFYRVRYGHAELTPGQRGRLRTVLGRLEGELAGSVVR